MLLLVFRLLHFWSKSQQLGHIQKTSHDKCAAVPTQQAKEWCLFHPFQGPNLGPFYICRTTIFSSPFCLCRAVSVPHWFSGLNVAGKLLPLTGMMIFGKSRSTFFFFFNRLIAICLVAPLRGPKQ